MRFVRMISFCALVIAASLDYADADVVFVYEGACTDLNRADCTAFGLEVGDAVQGFISVPTEFGEPGAISQLQPDQYDFGFQFGAYTFTEDDSNGLLALLISSTGASISSMAGSYQNSIDNNIKLSLVIPSVVQIARGTLFMPGFTRADTFGDGSAWVLGDESDIFTKPAEVPLPATGWLMVSILLLKPLRQFKKRLLRNSLRAARAHSRIGDRF